MPTSVEPPAAVLVDTSIAVALSLVDHDFHATTRDALHGRTLGLAGHAYFETYSVLSRLPSPARRSSRDIGRLLGQNFPGTRFLDEATQLALRDELVRLGIAGGSVYDALVGAAARQHSLRLATRDGRALDIYRRLDVDVEILE